MCFHLSCCFLLWVLVWRLQGDFLPDIPQVHSPSSYIPVWLANLLPEKSVGAISLTLAKVGYLGHHQNEPFWRPHGRMNVLYWHGSQSSMPLNPGLKKDAAGVPVEPVSKTRVSVQSLHSMMELSLAEHLARFSPSVQCVVPHGCEPHEWMQGSIYAATGEPGAWQPRERGKSI